MNYRDLFKRTVFIQSVLFIVLIWHIAANYVQIDSISSPALVMEATYELFISWNWIEHVWATLRRTLGAVAISIVVGVFIGVAMGISNFWETFFNDAVIGLLAFPSLLLAVIPAMWFGISDWAPITAGALAAFPFVAISVHSGTNNIDVGLIDMSNSFNMSKLRMIKRVFIPTLLPELFAAARYAFSICFKVVALTELVITTTGVGWMIRFSLDNLDITGVITWTLYFVVIITIIEYGILQPAEKRMFEWRPSAATGVR